MACLDNLIGISAAVDSAVPDSGRYLDELAYISIETADKAMNSEEVSGLSLLQKKLTLAQNKLITDIRTYLMPRSRMTSLLSNSRVGYYPTKRETVAPTSGTLKGMRFDLYASAYLKIYINSIVLWLDAAEEVNVKLYDLLTGVLLDTYTFTTTANQPTVHQVDTAYETETQYARLGLLVETTGNAYRTSVFKSWSGCSTCRNKPSDGLIRFSGIRIPDSGAKLYENTTQTDNTFGLGMNYSVQCSMDTFACNFKDALVEPLMNKAAELILREVGASDRLNSIVLHHDAEVDSLMEYYMNEYKLSLKTVLDSMRIPEDICFNYTPRVGRAQRIP